MKFLDLFGQQVIKSEFWRLEKAKNYLVLDADCIFIRDFYQSDFIAKNDILILLFMKIEIIKKLTNKFGPKKPKNFF